MSDAARVADMVERIERIRTYTTGGRAAFLAVPMIQDAVLHNLEVVGEAAKAVSVATRRRYPKVPWRKLSGLRDVAIHQDQAVQIEQVWEVVAKDLPRIREELARMDVRP